MISGIIEKEDDEREGLVKQKLRRSLLIHVVIVVQWLRHVWPFVTPWTAAHQASLSFTIPRSLLKFLFFESVMLCNHLILCHPLLLLSIFFSNRVFSNELALHIRWSKYWSFSFSISSSNEYSGLISFRIDWFDLLADQGISRVFSSTTVWKHQFFGTQLFYGPTLTCMHDCWKNHSFD